MSEPFLIFSWFRPFLLDLKNRIMEDTQGKPGNALIIVPNQRPWRYLLELFAQDHKAAMLPQMMPFTDVASLWAMSARKRPCIMANILDQVALLMRAVRDLAENDSGLAAKFAQMDMGAFLPWGMKLANLLEDIFRQGIAPKDIKVEAYEAGEYGAALIAALGRLGARWQELLAGAGYVTPGLEYFQAAQAADAIPALLMPQPGRPVYIAGFSTLTGSEQKLFRSLWTQGARICLHADPALAAGGDVDKICEAQKKWLRSWGAKAQGATEPDKRQVSHSFFAGYDGHSQLGQMVRDLDSVGTGSVAIVLPQPDLLMPVLHHLPDKDVNISMGYPLSRTRLYGLLSEIFTLRGSRNPDGKFYWKDLLRLLHHPLLGMLEDPQGVALRPALEAMDLLLRSGAPYVDAQELLLAAQAQLTPQEADFLCRVAAALITGADALTTPGSLARYLENFCDFLIANSSHALHSYPVDEEALARLRDNVLPVLANNEMADDCLDLSALRILLFKLLDEERIPFEADPLVGTQILGMLETRLLHFDNVFILDASDDFLPGTPAQDPLLPDILRSAAGLPDSGSRRSIVAYNLFRLCNNAKHVYWYWSEGVTPSNLDIGKRSRSRYIERIVWELEKEKKQLLPTGGEAIRAATPVLHVNPGMPESMLRNESLQKKMEDILCGTLSATMCDAYLSCPLKFAFKYIFKLKAPASVKEGEDAGLIGRCVHNILADIFSPYIGQQAPSEDLKLSFSEYYRRRVEEMALEQRLPIEAYIYFDQAARKYLSQYLEKIDNPACVLEIEKEYKVTLALSGRQYKFLGIIDRIDDRAGRAVILDYKTSSDKYCKIDNTIWQDGNFLNKLASWTNEQKPDLGQGDQYLEELRARLSSIQLPAYALMVAESRTVANAGYVWLWRTGKKTCEDWLWSQDLDPDEGLRGARIILAFLLRHMEVSPRFQAVSANCKYCDFGEICGSRMPVMPPGL